MRSAITSNTQSTDKFDVESMSRSRFILSLSTRTLHVACAINIICILYISFLILMDMNSIYMYAVKERRPASVVFFTAFCFFDNVHICLCSCI